MSKREYLEAIFIRYKKASFKEKTAILNEFCSVCGYHRKHATRLLNNFKRFTKPKSKKRGNPSKYNKPSVIEPLKKIWLTANLPCSKRLKAIIPLWLPAYAKEFGGLSLDVVKALLKISPATIDRLLEEMFSTLKLLVGRRLSDSQLRQIVDRTIAELDTDGDGKLNFAEFKQVILLFTIVGL